MKRPLHDFNPRRTTADVSLIAAASSVAAYIVRTIQRNRRASLAVAGVLVVLSALITYRAFSRKPLDSFAVLPFTNVGGDPSTEYLSDRITESVINNLFPNTKAFGAVLQL